jgi:hypothetical protein
MSLDKVSDVNVVSVTFFLNQLDFFPEQVSSVLEAKLGDRVYDFDNLAGFDAVHFEGVEKTHEVGHLRTQQTS